MSITWQAKQWSIGEFILESSKINIESLIQRLMISPILEGSTTPSKMQSIIQTILDGYDVGEIKLNQIGNIYDSIDGGHRKRAITLFMANRFRLHKSSPYGEVYFRELPEEDQTFFKNFKLRVIIYDNLSNVQMGEMFRSTNTVTPVNHMEMLNSFGDLSIANAIRNTVRQTTHKLFESSLNKKGEEKFTYFNFDNKRLKIEEVVCRLYCQYFKNNALTTTSDKSCLDMYKENLSDDVVDNLKPKVEEVFDFILLVSKEKKYLSGGTGLGYKEVVLLIRMYVYLKNEYDTFSFKNVQDFYKEFKKVLDSFIGKHPTKTKPWTDDRGVRTESEAMRGYLGDHKVLKKIQQTVDWILADMDILDYIILKDPKRAFPRALVEQVLALQDYKDYVDGKPLTLENAVGAHITAHKDGGRTTIDNLAVTSIEHNSRMGSMNLEDYKKLWLENNA